AAAKRRDHQGAWIRAFARGCIIERKDPVRKVECLSVWKARKCVDIGGEVFGGDPLDEREFSVGCSQLLHNQLLVITGFQRSASIRNLPVLGQDQRENAVK